MSEYREINRRFFMEVGICFAKYLLLGLVITSVIAYRFIGTLFGVGVYGTAKDKHRVTLKDMVWQIDPDKCTSCGKCSSTCVLNRSASKALNCFDMCGYCDICTGYFTESYFDLDTGAENHLCPTDALSRTFIEQKSGQRFFEYTVDKDRCIGCAKCVKGCALMNGSLYMQIDQHDCVGCNECSIALQCPAKAFYRIPASQQEILKVDAVGLLENRAKKLLESDDPSKKQAGERLLARCKMQRQWRREQEADTPVTVPAGEGADA